MLKFITIGIAFGWSFFSELVRCREKKLRLLSLSFTYTITPACTIPKNYCLFLEKIICFDKWKS
jgi:hypothetical protein